MRVRVYTRWIACVILCTGVLMNNALGEEPYRKLVITNNDRVSWNAYMVPQSERLCDLGYLGNSTPKLINKETQGVELPREHYAALNIFAQLNGLNYRDGVISVETQRVFDQTNADSCPVALPGYDTKALLSLKENDCK